MRLYRPQATAELLDTYRKLLSDEFVDELRQIAETFDIDYRFNKEIVIELIPRADLIDERTLNFIKSWNQKQYELAQYLSYQSIRNITLPVYSYPVDTVAVSFIVTKKSNPEENYQIIRDYIRKITSDNKALIFHMIMGSYINPHYQLNPNNIIIDKEPPDKVLSLISKVYQISQDSSKSKGKANVLFMKRGKFRCKGKYICNYYHLFGVYFLVNFVNTYFDLCQEQMLKFLV